MLLPFEVKCLWIMFDTLHIEQDYAPYPAMTSCTMVRRFAVDIAVLVPRRVQACNCCEHRLNQRGRDTATQDLSY